MVALCGIDRVHLTVRHRYLAALLMVGIVLFASGFALGHLRASSAATRTVVEGGRNWHNRVVIEVARAHDLDFYVRKYGPGFTFENDHQVVYNVLTNEGKDWIERALSDSSAINSSLCMKWIGLSASSSTPDATWNATVWHNSPEITGYGLQRQAGTYSSTGVGQWQVQKQFTATGSVLNVRLSGLLIQQDGDPNEKLIFVASFTSVNLEANDQITITWQISVS
jgi:hypothetical protein